MNAEQLNTIVEAQVKEFQTAMGQTMTMPLALSMVASEGLELEEAVKAIAFKEPTVEAVAHCLKELADFTYTIAGLNMVVTAESFKGPESLEQVKWMHDIGIGANAALQLNQMVFSDTDILEAIALVHTSNMTKVGDDGKPVFNAEGKVTKGPNYVAPDLTALATSNFPRVKALWQDNQRNGWTEAQSLAA